MQINRKKKSKKPASFFCSKYTLIKPDTHLESKAYESKHQIVIRHIQARSSLYSVVCQNIKHQIYHEGLTF